MPEQLDSSIISSALRKMASTQKKSKRPILKPMVDQQKDHIELALGQGYTYDEIAQRIHEASVEAYPENPEMWITIAPSTLRKYLYQARQQKTSQQQHTSSDVAPLSTMFKR